MNPNALPGPENGTFAQREPLVLWNSVLTGLYILTAGAALGDFVGVRVAGLLVLIVAALQGGTQFYIRGTVTSNFNVVARRNSQGETVAGSALPAVINDTPVEVVPAAPEAA